MSAGDRGSLTSMVRYGEPGGLGEHPDALVSLGRHSGPNPTHSEPEGVPNPTDRPRRAAHFSSAAAGRCPVVANCTLTRGRGGAGTSRGGWRSIVAPGLDRELVSGEGGAGPQKRLSARGRSKRLNLEPGVTAARPQRLYPPRAWWSDEFASCERRTGPRVSGPARPMGCGPALDSDARGASLSRGCRRATGGRRRRGRPRVR